MYSESQLTDLEECGAERPRNEFDTCILPLDHDGDYHEDAAGHTWSTNFQDWVK